MSHFCEIGCAGPIFAANAKGLQGARKSENDGSPNSDICVSGAHSNQQCAEAHGDDREHQGAAAANFVSDYAENNAAEWAQNKCSCKHNCCVQGLSEFIGGWEE